MKFVLFTALVSVCLFSCNPSTSVEYTDNSTPEGAVYLIEEAYKNQDMEAAIESKDFRAEAFYMLNNMIPGLVDLNDPNDSLITSTAEVLELSFKAEIENNGFPDFQGQECSFTEKVDLGDGFLEITEHCKWSDGGVSDQKLLVYFNGENYKVLNPLSE